MGNNKSLSGYIKLNPGTICVLAGRKLTFQNMVIFKSYLTIQNYHFYYTSQNLLLKITLILISIQRLINLVLE